MTRVRSDNDWETRAKRKEAMASSEVGCLFSKGVTMMKMIEPVVNPSAMVRRRVIDSDSDDED